VRLRRRRRAARAAHVAQEREEAADLYTVFAGMETEATAKAREFFKPYRPSSPQIGILKDGKLVKMFQRQDIEGRDPSVIAQELVKAFNELG